MKKLLRISAAGVMALGLLLSPGLVSAEEATIDTTGPMSTNVVRFENDHNVDVDNKTDVDLDNDTDQDADSGDATVDYNTTGDDAETGDASNDNSFSVDGTVDNSSANAAALAGANGSGDNEATIENTGPRSDNRVVFNNTSRVDVYNHTDLDIDNDTDQDAKTGNAVVSNNTTGGGAQTGDASNTNSTSINFHVIN